MEIVKIMMVVAQIVKLKIYGHVINKFHYKIHYIIIPYVHYVEMEKEKETVKLLHGMVEYMKVTM